MECLDPGAIHDEELLAYLAGEKVRPLVEQHLTTCQYCSNRLADYRRLELTLSSKLFRWDCPPNQVLGEYELGLLSKELNAAVKNHLSMCVQCAAEVASLVGFLANDPMLAQPVPQVAVSMPSTLVVSSNNHHTLQDVKRVLDNVRERTTVGVRRIAATLVPPAPRLAFQRGESAQAAFWPRRYTAEDISISVQVDRGTSRRDALQLIGFVTRKDVALESLQGVPVQLVAQDDAQYKQSIDELGNFVFSSVAPATYTLELQFPESTIVIDELPVAFQD
ncbi:MAG TPA: hypothetical protein VKR42_00445 [Ktedonobacteraceae bacterium]|nr:hypothetical protein [Ktedonobacteraceae bacterium]